MSNVLITGGAGFIGANFVHYWRLRHPQDRIVVLDALTYAGNPANLASLSNAGALAFVHGDVCDEALVAELFQRHRFELVVHFAAESHVDRSIAEPDAFIRTNVQGTHTLLKAALAAWKDKFEGRRFHHISTDEVYGSLDQHAQPFTETSNYDPRSPYAASKAASDLLVRAYAHTYGLPATISNCSNNYGRFQFPEKLVPLMILNALTGQPLPVYGDGLNVRDWIHVEDHCAAIGNVLEFGRVGETYNIGCENETTNIALVRMLCDLIDRQVRASGAVAERFPECPGAKGGACKELITFIKDRPGHDRRYAIDPAKFMREIGRLPSRKLTQGLAETIEWYIDNESWWRPIQSGEYRQWLASHYGL